MVLTKPELVALLQNEVRILLHLISKIEPSMLEYRPTPKQRSTIELLRYLSLMGPQLVKAAKAGAFNPEAWGAAAKDVEGRDLQGVVALIAAQSDEYAALISDMPDADFRTEIEMFGRKVTRGAFLVSTVLGGCAAYRTQLFLYLKACGRSELSTMNLWGGIDAPAAAV